MDSEVIIPWQKIVSNSSKSPTGNTKKVLIIDDSEVNRHLLKALLKQIGLESYSAVDGDEGLNQFKKINPDITFLDIVMPKRSGLDILKELKTIKPDAIIIMISSYVNKQNIQEAKNSGADWFVIKPFTREKILEVIDKFSRVS
ncbi:MAG TPA: response regulator [bacterium]|nr:response regulator [bacterium]